MSDNSQFFCRGGIDQNGREKPGDDPSFSHRTQAAMRNINWPVLGIINRVHFADSVTNKSQQAKTAHSGTSNKTVTSDGYLKSLQEGTSNKGHRLECDVMVVQGLTGYAETTLLFSMSGAWAMVIIASCSSSVGTWEAQSSRHFTPTL